MAESAAGKGQRFWFGRKYPTYIQHSEEDCGAACLAAIARHYGMNFAISRIRETVGTGQQGTSLLGLKRGAEQLGFTARSVKTTPEILERLDEVPLPAIIHWMGYHWVILYGEAGDRFVLMDPAIGVRRIEREELAIGWSNWVMLLLEPDWERLAEQSDDPSPGIQRFFKRAWRYRSVLAEVLVINLVLGMLSLTSPFLIQILTDDVLVRQDVSLLNAVAIAVMVMTVLSGSLSYVQANLIAHFAYRLELGLVMEFGRQLLRLPLSYYEARRSGEIASRLQDIQIINQWISQVIVSLPGQGFVAIVSLGLMLVYSWQLTIAALLIALLMFLTTVAFLPLLQQKTRRALALEAETQGVLVETFKGALTLKTTIAADQFWDELQHRFSRLATLNFRTTQIGIANHTFSSLVAGVGSISLLWLGSGWVMQGQLSIGQLLAFHSLNRHVGLFISSIIGFVDEFARAKAATQRLVEVIDATPEAQTHKPTVTLSDRANIVCAHVTFYYPGRVELIQNLSLTIPGGKVTALIGKSGCGKSTLVKLIAGLYPLQSGNIQVDQYNLPDLSLDCLRQQVVLVPQEPHFWSRSILENFRLGQPQIDFADIVRACQIADADRFISQLPDKYQTVLGEFGANLSGGQRQRLAIARALLTHPPILMLDESTSGLDPVSETQLLDQLLAYRRGKTTLLISHRPSVIQRADWVILLEQGQVKMQGSLLDLQNQTGEHLGFLQPPTPPPAASPIVKSTAKPVTKR